MPLQSESGTKSRNKHNEEGSETLKRIESTRQSHEERTGVLEGDCVSTEEEDIDFGKELVKWSGRLEMESIDLRQKSTMLTKEFSANSKALQSVTSELKKGITKMTGIVQKCSATQAKDSGNSRSMANSLKKLESIYVDLSKKFDHEGVANTPINKLRDLDQSLKDLNGQVGSVLQTLNKIQNGSRDFQSAVSHTGDKVIELQGSFASVSQEVKEMKSSVIQLSNQRNITSLDFLTDNVLKCSRRLDQMAKLQLGFSKQMMGMLKVQNDMRSEMNIIKKGINNTRGSFETPPHTDGSIYGSAIMQTSRKTSYERKFQHRKRARIATSIQNEPDTFIGLFSDVPNTPEI